MPEKRLMQTKALSAFLTFRQTPLVSTLTRIGLSGEAGKGETLSDDIVGRIARLLGFTVERLHKLVDEHTAEAARKAAALAARRAKR
jgi:hypothetical protein